MSPAEQEFDKKLSEFVDDFLLRIYAAGLDPITQETPSVEEQFRVLHEEFSNHFNWAKILIAQVKSMRKSEEEIPLELAIRSFGMQNARSFLISYKLSEILTTKLLAIDPKTESITTPLGALIQYAPKLQTEFGEDSRYKDIAYASGLLLDILNLQASGLEDAAVKKQQTDMIANAYTHAVKMAKMGIVFAKREKHLPMEKFLVAIPILSEISKIAMARMIPKYAAFLKAIEKKPISLLGQLLFEEETFGGNHFEFAHFLSYAFKVLEPTSESILNFAYPMAMIDPKDKEGKELALVSLLAWQIYFKPGEAPHPKGKIKAGDYRSELSDLHVEFDVESVTSHLRAAK